MNDLKDLIQEALASGALSDETLVALLEEKRTLDLGVAKFDLSREERTGFPEVIYGKEKSVEELRTILEGLQGREFPVLVTKLSQEKYEALLPLEGAQYHHRAELLTLGALPKTREEGVLICAAGTSDRGIAEEAALTLEAHGISPKRLYDVGVAGLHRLLSQEKALQEAKVILVVAGMEGALLSVVTGLVKAPVIGIPTSVGYGASFQGLAALLAMLNSCAAGSAVVNIDNGFGAAQMALRILNEKKRP